MSQYFKGSGPFDFFAPLGTHLLNFFGNIARAVPRGYRAAAAEAPVGTPEVAAAGAPPRAYPQPCRGPKTSWIALFCPLNMGLIGGERCGQPESQYVYMFGRTLLTPRDSC